MNPSAQDLWAAFLVSDRPEAAPAAGTAYTAWRFGDSPAMADELLALVLAGHKRATASALWVYEHDQEPIPQVGDYSVILDGAGQARCILRTTSIEITPFAAVSAAFAAAEGEGDGSLEYWRQAHQRFFSRELAALGRTPTPEMPVVCEQFEVVYAG